MWPDFVACNQIGNYWTKIAADFHAKVPFDGMWLVNLVIRFFFFFVKSDTNYYVL